MASCGLSQPVSISSPRLRPSRRSYSDTELSQPDMSSERPSTATCMKFGSTPDFARANSGSRSGELRATRAALALTMSLVGGRHGLHVTDEPAREFLARLEVEHSGDRASATGSHHVSATSWAVEFADALEVRRTG